MAAINGKRKVEIKREMFSSASEHKKLTNAFGRKRRRYLTAVVREDFTVRERLEAELFERMKKSTDAFVQSIPTDPVNKKNFMQWLQKGVPLSNAIEIAKQTRYLQDTNERIAGNARYRTPAMLKREMALLELEYQSLRLARKKAISEGLVATAAQLEKEIKGKALRLGEYRRIFSDDGRLKK